MAARVEQHPPRLARLRLRQRPPCASTARARCRQECLSKPLTARRRENRRGRCSDVVRHHRRRVPTSRRSAARLITPVPGGVGPMTIALLVEQTVEADWYTNDLYDFLADLGLTTIRTPLSRFVADPNRAPNEWAWRLLADVCRPPTRWEPRYTGRFSLQRRSCGAWKWLTVRSTSSSTTLSRRCAATTAECCCWTSTASECRSTRTSSSATYMERVRHRTRSGRPNAHSALWALQRRVTRAFQAAGYRADLPPPKTSTRCQSSSTSGATSTPPDVDAWPMVPRFSPRQSQPRGTGCDAPSNRSSFRATRRQGSVAVNRASITLKYLQPSWLLTRSRDGGHADPHTASDGRNDLAHAVPGSES